MTALDHLPAAGRVGTPAPAVGAVAPFRHRGRGGDPAWVGLAAAVLAVLAVVDLAVGNRTTLPAAVVLTPFLASVGARPVPVAGVGLAALGTSFGLAVYDGIGTDGRVDRAVVLVLGTALAVVAAGLRTRRERRLAELSDVAEAVQRAIIRQPPARVGELAVASWYESSAQAATVGGDCYEALDTAFGTRLLIGDVRGHGLPGVRLAALVLGAFRALAHLEPDLDAIAGHLDGVAARYAAERASTGGDGEEFVTAVLVEVNGPAMAVANCGHVPPVLALRPGGVRLLEAARPALPLGLGSEPTVEHVDLPPGARVLLYTDGLVEARDARGRFLDVLDAAGALPQGSLDAALGSVVDRLRAHAGGRYSDDVALLAFERAPGRARR